MRYEEFKLRLSRADLTVRQFADHIGIGASTVSNYAGRPRVPTHFAVIATLMAHMKEHGLDFDAPLSGIEIPRSQGDLGAKCRQQKLFREYSREN